MLGRRSFKEYVSKRFDNEIFNYIASYVEETDQDDFDSLDLRVNRLHQIGEVELSETKGLHVDAYDLLWMRVGFDVRVEAIIEVCEGDYHYDEQEYPQQWFVLSCSGDLEKNLDDFDRQLTDKFDLIDVMEPVYRPAFYGFRCIKAIEALGYDVRITYEKRNE